MIQSKNSWRCPFRGNAPDGADLVTSLHTHTAIAHGGARSWPCYLIHCLKRCWVCKCNNIIFNLKGFYCTIFLSSNRDIWSWMILEFLCCDPHASVGILSWLEMLITMYIYKNIYIPIIFIEQFWKITQYKTNSIAIICST